MSYGDALLEVSLQWTTTMAKRVWDTSLFTALYGWEFVSDWRFATIFIVNMALQRFRLPPNKVEVQTLWKVSKHFWRVAPITVQGGGGGGGRLLESPQIIGKSLSVPNALPRIVVSLPVRAAVIQDTSCYSNWVKLQPHDPYWGLMLP